LARARRLGTGRRVARAHLPFGLPAAYWLDLAAHRPAEQLAREPRPVLVLHAERDYQVTADDLAGWQAALASKANATIIRYPELNHLFMAGEGNSTPSEYLRPGTLSPRLIDDIAAWVERHTTGGATARAGDRAGYSQG
jgi:hypothetical protein